MNYISNAFSLQMVEAPATISVFPVTREDVPTDAVSVMGHPDTAKVLGLVFNRVSVKLTHGDVLYVAQLVGGRLAEGATTLPEGASFAWLKVVIL